MTRDKIISICALILAESHLTWVNNFEFDDDEWLVVHTKDVVKVDKAIMHFDKTFRIEVAPDGVVYTEDDYKALFRKVFYTPPFN